MSTERGLTVWFTGLSGAGKSTLAGEVAARIGGWGHRVEILDGDLVRQSLCAGLGFSKEDRDTNIRRVAFVAELLTRNGVVVCVAAISPYREVREEVRRRIGTFVEVYVRCPLDELVRRDVKGLYARALAGEIAHFTGVSDPYEEPHAPNVLVDTGTQTIEEAVSSILRVVEGALGEPAAATRAEAAEVAR
ncbi:MAG: adenylyl-sulfate kinase [Candidatus Dormibacteria bacterium]